MLRSGDADIFGMIQALFSGDFRAGRRPGLSNQARINKRRERARANRARAQMWRHK